MYYIYTQTIKEIKGISFGFLVMQQSLSPVIDP